MPMAPVLVLAALMSRLAAALTAVAQRRPRLVWGPCRSSRSNIGRRAAVPRLHEPQLRHGPLRDQRAVGLRPLLRRIPATGARVRPAARLHGVPLGAAPRGRVPVLLRRRLPPGNGAAVVGAAPAAARRQAHHRLALRGRHRRAGIPGGGRRTAAGGLSEVRAVGSAGQAAGGPLRALGELRGAQLPIRLPAPLGRAVADPDRNRRRSFGARRASRAKAMGAKARWWSSTLPTTATSRAPTGWSRPSRSSAPRVWRSSSSCSSGGPNAEVREAVLSCDIVAEQFIAGYALFAIEGMAAARPVLSALSWMAPEVREQLDRRGLPIIDTDLDTLKLHLRQLVEDPGRRRSSDTTGRDFVARPAFARSGGPDLGRGHRTRLARLPATTRPAHVPGLLGCPLLDAPRATRHTGQPHRPRHAHARSGGRRRRRKILSGELIAGDGSRFAIREGVPRMVPELSSVTEDDGATQRSFGAKWDQYQEEEKDQLADFQDNWFDERFGFSGDSGLEEFLAGRRRPRRRYRARASARPAVRA